MGLTPVVASTTTDFVFKNTVSYALPKVAYSLTPALSMPPLQPILCGVYGVLAFYQAGKAVYNWFDEKEKQEK